MSETSLAEFLLARIAEDEAAAHRTADYGGCCSGCQCGCSASTARVLAECEAKRRIVANERTAHEVMRCAPYEEQVSAKDGPAAAYWRGQDYVLRALALPYDEHPDFREEWRP